MDSEQINGPPSEPPRTRKPRRPEALSADRAPRREKQGLLSVNGADGRKLWPRMNRDIARDLLDACGKEPTIFQRERIALLSPLLTELRHRTVEMSACRNSGSPVPPHALDLFARNANAAGRHLDWLAASAKEVAGNDVDLGAYINARYGQAIESAATAAVDDAISERLSPDDAFLQLSLLTFASGATAEAAEAISAPEGDDETPLSGLPSGERQAGE